MSNLHHLVSKQITRWNKDQAAWEKMMQEQKGTEAVRPADIKPVVTISRQRGCRGRELAKLLAHDLQYGLLDRSIINYIAEHMGVRSELVELLDEHDRSELELWIGEMLSGTIFHHDSTIRALGEVVKSISLHGGVVIVGRGANYFLPASQAQRVRVVAPLSTRINTLVDLEGKEENEARNEIERVDGERAQFVKRYFRKDINNLIDYDLTINMVTNTLDGAVKTIITALRARGWTLQQTGGNRRVKTPVEA